MAGTPPRWRIPGPEGLRGVVASLADGIMVVDLAGRIRFANPAAAALFGQSPAALAGADFGHPVRAGEVAEIELLVDGLPRVVEMRTSAGRWNGDQVIVVALRDVSVRARAVAELEELARHALHDPLTGLPNRSLLLDRLRQAIARAERTQGSLAVLFVDLDGFKAINDRLGHDVGDQVLRAVAQQLRSAVRPPDTVCRLGGDEFVVVCEGVDGLAEAEEIARRVEVAVAEPCLVAGHEVRLTASVGVVVPGVAAASPEHLLGEADAAMYLAKREGKSRHRVFDDTLRAQADERASLEAGLHDAAETGRLSLVYQPVISLATGAVDGAEALLRYNDPEHGTVAADRFIVVAEESGLIVALGTWALQLACREAAGWWQRGWQVPVTVNLGPAQTAHPALVADVHSALDQAGLAPEALTLDLTETAVGAASASTLRRLGELHDAGVRLGIDNWGLGPASLTTLARAHFDYIKLDRSVVAGLERDPRVATALLAGANGMGLAALAQGIERPRQLELLEALGCTAGQGNHLAPAMASEALVALLAAGGAAGGVEDGSGSGARPG